MPLVVKVVDGVLAGLLSRTQREHLGRHILNVARGEGNGDPKTNGEYALLESVKEIWRSNRVSPVVFDVGANVGAWSTKALTGLPAGSKVYAFEPSPQAFGVLLENPGIEAMNLALGECDARLPFYVSSHELKVLKGFSQMLQLQRIDYIQFEYGCTWADSHSVLGDAFDFLLPLRYQLAKIHPSGVQFFPEYDQRQETFAFANYLAVREELAGTLRGL